MWFRLALGITGPLVVFILGVWLIRSTPADALHGRHVPSAKVIAPGEKPAWPLEVRSPAARFLGGIALVMLGICWALAEMLGESPF